MKPLVSEGLDSKSWKMVSVLAARDDTDVDELMRRLHGQLTPDTESVLSR